MDAEHFNYDLPPERIAQQALVQRDACKLLVVDRKRQRIEHTLFKHIGDYLLPTDTLFRNAAKVLPARIHAQRSTGGQVECLLLRKTDESNQTANNDERTEEWICLLRPGKRLPPGSAFGIEGEFTATVAKKNEQAEYHVVFHLKEDASITKLAERIGKMPLPPYIKRERRDDRDTSDLQDYQTIYADSRKAVAAAAPTAGLHFTPELESQLSQHGITFNDLILHVGMGTFKPLDEGAIQNHQIHTERYEIPEAAQVAYHAAADSRSRRVCVGTTSVRSLEDYVRNGAPRRDESYLNEAGLFIFPPDTIQSTDCLITNFHLPKSTLLCLVSAFLTPGSTDGIDWLKSIYQEAIANNYRFLSYGDAMLIV